MLVFIFFVVLSVLAFIMAFQPFDFNFSFLIDAKTARNKKERFYATQERKRKKREWQDILREISYRSTIGGSSSKNYIPLEYADDFKEKLERRGYIVNILTDSYWDKNMCYLIVNW